MADLEYGSIGGADKPVRTGEVVTLMNWLGALISVALIAGLGLWGYQLMVRDVSGVPVVRALEGPMRAAPDDPGGLDAEHQGLAVNRIAAEGEAAAPADRLVLAPAPITLAEEDQTASELAANTMLDSTITDEPGDALATDLAVAEALTSSAEAGEPLALDRDELITTALQLAADSANTTSTQPKPDQVDAGIVVPDGAIPASIAGVSRSPRPAARPSALLASLGAQPSALPGVIPSANPENIPVGTRLAQLGAFESSDMAKAEWVKLTGQFEDVMGGKTRVIQMAQSGGKSFYRLRAMGFDNISDARRFCSTLLARKAACIPVITR